MNMETMLLHMLTECLFLQERIEAGECTWYSNANSLAMLQEIKSNLRELLPEAEDKSNYDPEIGKT
jgi:hypothetical protein